MTIDELNAMLEAITNEPSNDVLMLENFDKIRNSVKEIIEKVDSLTAKLNKSKDDYSKLRESKVSDFFKNPEDDAENKKEDDENKKEDDEEKNTTIKDLFEDGIEVEDIDEIKERDE